MKEKKKTNAVIVFLFCRGSLKKKRNASVVARKSVRSPLLLSVSRSSVPRGASNPSIPALLAEEQRKERGTEEERSDCRRGRENALAISSVFFFFFEIARPSSTSPTFPTRSGWKSKAPPAWAPRDGEPLIYITFGTVSGSSERAKATYRAALEAVSALPVRALLTTGPVMDSKALGPIPPNVAVETFVPQAEIFPFASAVVCHGGSGSLIGGLAAGLPIVVAPIFADQPVNARSVDVARLGVAVFDREVSGLRAAMQRVLVDAEIRSNALDMAAQIAALPTRDDAVEAMLAGL